MSKISIITCWMLLAQWSFAQVTASEVILQKVCNCMGGYEFETMEYKRMLVVGDSCMERGLLSNLTGLLSEYGVDMEDDKSMQKMGEVLANRLFSDCEAYRNYATYIAIKKLEEEREPYQITEGVLVKLDLERQPPLFVLWTTEDEALDFTWFREFDGSARFFGGVKDYENQRVEIFWEELELYDPLQQNYKIHREIKLIEDLDKVAKKEGKAILKKWKKYQKWQKRQKKAKK
ncbi:MAG: hypothetical protein GY810_25785 [Aureispira sp.]|nr:hypothetical protein [Aureispira sp.]